MDLQTRKIAFIQEFLRLQNEDIINGLEKMLRKRKAKLYEENLKPMSIEQFNSDIDLSLEDSEHDRGMSTRALKEEIKGWK